MGEFDVSVIVPVYNAEKYIGQCIESLLNQTKNKIEIIIVNDGSTDSSLSIIKAYKEKYSNIMLIDKPNEGVISARIEGLKVARGDYIGWVDADDFLEPKMVEILFNLIKNNHAECAYCNLRFYPQKVANKAVWFKKYTGKVDWDFIERNSQCTHFLTSKELLNRINIANSFAEFNEYGWISVMLNANGIVYTEEPLYIYRVGHQSASGGSYKGKVEKFIKGADRSSKLKKLLAGTPYEQTLGEYFDYRYIYSLLMLEIVAAINSDKTVYDKAAKELNRMNFKNNKYTKRILDYNHGKLKSFVVRYGITASYFIAKVITVVVFK